MRRAQLEDLLRELARVLGKREIAMIGSQCVHAATDTPPVEVLMSRECDILMDGGDPARERIDVELGSTSMYQLEHGTFVDTVSPSFPFLPDGWEQRANVLVSGEMRSRCLELHDLVLSKLAAGRLKDNELIAALIHKKLVNADIARARIAEVADLHMRAILLARLQIVLENVD
jgi:uncharacterized nucleotidyltransferase DUF6036